VVSKVTRSAPHVPADHFMAAFFARLKRFALAAALALAAAGAAAQGTVVAVGSGVRDDNDAVWNKLIELAGGKGAKFAVFTAPAGDPDAAATAIIGSLAKRGAVGEHIRVGPLIAGQDLAAAVRDPAWVARVDAAQAVFLSGGQQARLIDTLRPGGHDSPLLHAVLRLFARGGVVAGESAGAAVMSEVIFLAPPQDVLSLMKNPLREGQDIGRGLGLVRHDVIVDQHLIRRGRIGRLLALMQQSGKPLGLGIEEHTAIVVRGDEVEVVGDGGVLVADFTAARRDKALDAFNVRGARLSLLDHSDRYNLNTRRLTPAAAKLPGRLGVARPDFAGRSSTDQYGDSFFNDMLADNMMATALSRLVEQGHRQVVGLSFATRPDAKDPRPDLGFEWRLALTPDTTAYRLRPARYTIGEVELDIVPVLMQRPLYTPYRR
jgi:cyanophycinase